MTTKYIIDNSDGALSAQTINGSLSATTFYGDGSNLAGIGDFIEVTYEELETLIDGSSLVSGRTYKITGFNKNMPSGSTENPNGYLPEILYDDGNNLGITIYMVALTTTTLATSGYGEFYNPKYGDETTYNNTDGTGLYRIWDGDNPDPLQVPAYTIGDIVFWGGYAWENISGNVGSSDNILSLNIADWTKIPYSSTTWYNSVIDEIKVDWNNRILIERYNPENMIRVAFVADGYDSFFGIWDSIKCSPISTMAWGLYPKTTPELISSEVYGIFSIESINSLCETVSFKGYFFGNNKLNATYFNGYFGKGSYIEDNTLNGSYLTSNILTNNSQLYNNIINNGNIGYNTLDLSEIVGNSVILGSAVYFNTLYDSKIIDNLMSKTCEISFNTMNNNSEIVNNILTDISSIYNITLDDSKIQYNSLSQSNFNFSLSGSLTSVLIQKNSVQNANITADISSATHIYGNYTKQIFSREDGSLRLSYYDNTDTLQVVAVNA